MPRSKIRTAALKTVEASATRQAHWSPWPESLLLLSSFFCCMKRRRQMIDLWSWRAAGPLLDPRIADTDLNAKPFPSPMSHKIPCPSAERRTPRLPPARQRRDFEPWATFQQRGDGRAGPGSRRYSSRLWTARAAEPAERTCF